MCDVAHSYVWQDTLQAYGLVVYVAWLIHKWYVAHSWVPWPIHMWDKTPSCVWPDSFMCVSRLIMCVPWLIHKWDMAIPGRCDSARRNTGIRLLLGGSGVKHVVWAPDWQLCQEDLHIVLFPTAPGPIHVMMCGHQNRSTTPCARLCWQASPQTL